MKSAVKRLAVSIVAAVATMLQQSPALSNTQPRLVVDTGHDGQVFPVVISPNGSIGASGSADEAINIYDLVSKRQVNRIYPNAGFVFSLAFSPDGSKLAAGCMDGSLQIWDLKEGKKLRSWTTKTDEYVLSVAFSPDGLVLASAGTDNCVRLRELSTGKEIKSIGFEASADCLDFSSDGKQLAFRTSDDSLHILDTSKFEDVSVSCPNILSVAIFPDGKSMLTGHSDGKILLHRLASKWTSSDFFRVPGGVNDLKLNQSGLFLLASHGNDASLIDLRSKTIKAKFVGHTDFVSSADFNQSLVMTGSEDCSVRLWDIASGGILRIFRRHIPLTFSVKYSADGFLLVEGGAEVRILDPGSSKHVKFFHRTEKSDCPAIFGYQPNSVFIQDKGGCFLLVDFASGNTICKLPIKAEIVCCCFDSGGDNLVFGTQDGKLCMWSIKQSKIEWSKVASKERINCLALSPDGTKVATGGYDGLVKVWSKSTGEEVHTFSNSAGSVADIAFSPDGVHLACGSCDNNVYLWDAKKFTLLSTLQGHTGFVWSISFGREGAVLASGSHDGTIRLWQIPEGKVISTFRGHSTEIWSVCFSRDGSFLVSAGLDSHITFWDLEKEVELVTLCTIDDEDWIAFDSAGRFDFSDMDKLSALSWVMPKDPTKAVPVELFFRQYYEPNLFQRVMRHEQFTDVPPISNVMTLQPLVSIESVHELNDEFADVVVAFSEKIDRGGGKSLHSGVFDLRLFRDGQLVGYLPSNTSFSTSDSVNLASYSRKEGKFRHTFRVKIPQVKQGSTIFSAYAFNSNKVKSETAFFEFKRAKDSLIKKGRVWIIAFGANVYDDARWNLKYAVPDALSYGSELVPVLRKSGNYNGVVFIPLISDSEAHKGATKASLRCVLLALAGNKERSDCETIPDLNGLGKVEPEDTVIISFSCHGDADVQTGEYYLFGSDIGSSSDCLAGEAHGVGISSAELTDWLRDLDASEIILVIDACHSGAATGKDFKPGPMDSSGLGQLAYYKGMRILTASEAASAALEVRSVGHGLLTYALLKEGLSQEGLADTSPKDGRIDIGEWLRFARDRVPCIDRAVLSFISEKRVAAEARSFKVEGESSAQAHFRLQTPKLFDFSRKSHQEILLYLQR